MILGDRVRDSYAWNGGNLLVSLTTGGVLEGELGYDQLIILVGVYVNVLRASISHDSLRGTEYARIRCNSGTLRTSLWT